jgi:dienelactone hydrolase
MYDGLVAQPPKDPRQRLHFRRVTIDRSPAQEPGVENEIIPSLVEGISTRAQWLERRRPALLEAWTRILGRLEPTESDARWFESTLEPRIQSLDRLAAYDRLTLELPLETDFRQPALLLLPRSAPPWPGVVAWTSSTPDWRTPEYWWGAWLASRGFAVLCSWSHIRHYRGPTYSALEATKAVYARFGRWSGMSRMVWDVRQQARFLGAWPGVDSARLAFIGMSLSAKTAVYAAAFAPELAAVVSIDAGLPLNGATNYFAPWYLDWTTRHDDIPTPEQTVLSLLKGTRTRPGFQHDHHEVLALAAPRPFLLVGSSTDELSGWDRDDLSTWGYINRAAEVYRLFGAERNLIYHPTNDGHTANGPNITPAWQRFLTERLKG